MSESEDFWDEVDKYRANQRGPPPMKEKVQCLVYGGECGSNSNCDFRELDPENAHVVSIDKISGDSKLGSTLGIFRCKNEDCGIELTYNPHDKITTIANPNKVQKNEDLDWAGTCLFVAKLKTRPGRKKPKTEEAAKLRKQMENLKDRGYSEVDPMYKKAGITNNYDDYTETDAIRMAGQLLGMFPSAGGGSDSMKDAAKLCPPFSKPTKDEKRGDMDIQIAVSKHIHGSKLPERQFGFRGSRNCEIPSHKERVGNYNGEANDKLNYGARIGLEILFRMEAMGRPWSISHWIKRFPQMTEKRIAICLIQGGPLSNYAHQLMKKRTSDSIDVDSLIKGFIDNLNDFKVIKLSENEMKEIQQNSEEIHSLLSKLEVDGKDAIQYLLDNWCILGFRKQGEFEQTTFWSIGVAKQCESLGHVHHPTILVGLIVAQALYNKNYRNCNQHKTVLNNVVFVDNKWTGNKRDDMIYIWGSLMTQIDVKPCTDYL